MRRWIALAVTLWLIGWVPSIVWSWRVFGGPQFYAVWIILAPCWGVCAAAALYGLGLFYTWALARPSVTTTQQRIEQLEQELGIHD